MPDNDNLSRRRFIEGAGITGATIIAGCTGQPSEETDTPATSPTGTAASQEGGHLIVSMSRNVQTLNPVTAEPSADRVVINWFYSTLTWLDADLEVHPDLATDWEANDDATEWTFNLDEDSTFHNGEQVTSEDVKATFDTVVFDEEVASPGKDQLGPISEVVAEDPTTVRISLNSPDGLLPKRFAKAWSSIVPKSALNNNFDQLGAQEFGSGPFQLESFEVGNEIIGTAFEDYHLTDEDGNQLPHLSTVTQLVQPDTGSEITALGNKDADLMYEVPPSQWNRVTEMSGVQEKRTTAGTFSNLVMRSDKPPFDDNRVRRAFKLAIDREAVLEGAANGLGSVASDTVISPAYEFHTEIEPPERDLDKAKSLIDDAGYGDGIELTLFSSNTPSYRLDTGILFQEHLNELPNVNLEVQETSHDRYVSEVWSKKKLYMGTYFMRITADAILYLLLHSDGAWNESHWSDDEFDSALETASSTTDTQVQEKNFAKCQQILHDRGPYVVAYFLDVFGAARNYVNNYHLHPTKHYIRVHDMHLGEGAPDR